MALCEADALQEGIGIRRSLLHISKEAEMANPFVPNWRALLARAWSMWAIAVSIVFSAVEMPKLTTLKSLRHT